MLEQIDSSWFSLIKYLHEEPLKSFKNDILSNCSYQPHRSNIFRVFNQPLSQIKVVILGQDPFPTPGDAIGLSFINGTNKIPVSLRNIYKEIVDSTNINEPNGKEWEKQGVFLLNTALTVQTGNAGSHLEYWKEFTKETIKLISSKQPCIWLLWGKKAQSFIPYINGQIYKVNDYKNLEELPINEDYNYVFESAHPAAEAYSGGKAGFFGCNHFYNTNQLLLKLNKSTILW